MSSSEAIEYPPFWHIFTVGPESIDRNGHVNNVDYVRWMQDAATAHSDAAGASELLFSLNASWVARSHHIEYLKPAFEGDVIEIETWIENVQRVRSVRQYHFRRKEDGVTLARGETLWIYINLESGRPQTIPPEMDAIFRQRAMGSNS